MSVLRRSVLVCGCGARLEREIARSVNGGRTPQLRAEILDGTFQRHRCDTCGRTSQFESPFLYLSFDDRHWIGCFPTPWEAGWRDYEDEPRATWQRVIIEHAPVSLRKDAAGWTVRAVFGIRALAEKLRCFDAGLDDRILEILKLELFCEQPVPVGPGRAMRLIGIDGATGDLLLSLPEPVGGNDMIRVSRARLDRLHDRREELAGAIRTLVTGPYVDIGRVTIPGTAEIVEAPRL